MLVIESTDEHVFGEDGPNFIWLGKCEDFKRVHEILSPLGERDDVRIALKDIKGELKFEQIEGSVFHSRADGDVLTKKADNAVEVCLPKDSWMRILIMIEDLSTTKGTHYVEFEDGFHEDLNWIMESS